MSRRRVGSPVLLAILVVAIAVAAGAVLHPSGRETLLAGAAWLQRSGAIGQVIAIAVAVVGVALGLPTFWFAAMLGYLFGMPGGLLLAILVIPCGATVSFILARWLFQDSIRALVGRRRAWSAVIEAVGTGGWRLVALMRLAAPHNIVTAVLATSSVGGRAFILGTLVGGFPSVALASSGGALAPDVSELLAHRSMGPLEIALLVAGGLCLVVVLLKIRALARAALARAAPDAAR